MNKKIWMMKTRQVGQTLAREHAYVRAMYGLPMMTTADELPDWALDLPLWKLHVVLDQLELEAGWFHTQLVEGSAKVLGSLNGT